MSFMSQILDIISNNCVNMIPLFGKIISKFQLGECALRLTM